MVSEAQRILFLEADVESGHDLLAKAIERTQFRDSQLAEANAEIDRLRNALHLTCKERDNAWKSEKSLEAEIATLRKTLAWMNEKLDCAYNDLENVMDMVAEARGRGQRDALQSSSGEGDRDG